MTGGNPIIMNTNFRLPNLRDRFVVGAQQDGLNNDPYPGVSPGVTGGSADAIVPNHTHTTSVDSGRLFHQGGQGNTVSYGGAGSYPGTVFSMQDPSNGETVTNKNLPPYYALAYIMKT